MAERQQVKYEPGQVALSNQIQRAGQYSVAVQQTPKTNSALEFAKAINQAPQLYGQAVTIAQKAGTQAALAVDAAQLEKELKESDPDTFLSFGRQKAFRQTLLKRSLNTNIIPKLNKGLDDITNPEDYKEKDFIETGLNPFLTKKWEEYSEDIGSTFANTVEARAVWNAVTDEFRGNALETYETKLEAYNVAGATDELGLELSVKTALARDDDGGVLPLPTKWVQEFAQDADKKLKTQGILSKESRKNVLITAYSEALNELVANDRMQDAEKLLAAIQVTKVGNQPIFNTTDGKAALRPAVKAILANRTSLSDDEEKDLDNDYVDASVSALSSLRTITTVEELGAFGRRAIENVFILTKPSLEGKTKELKTLVDDLFTNGTPLESFNQKRLDLAVTNGDTSYELAKRNNKAIDREFAYTIGGPGRPLQMTTTYKKEIIDKLLPEYLKTAKDGVDVNDFLAHLDAKGIGKHTNWEALGTAFDDATKGNFITKTTQYEKLNQTINAAIDTVELTIDEDYADSNIAIGKAYGVTLLARMEGLMKEEAKNWADIEDPTERETAINTWIRTTLADEMSYFKERATAASKQAMAFEAPTDRQTQDLNAPSTGKSTKGDRFNFESLENVGTTGTSRNRKYVSHSRELINKDREVMQSNTRIYRKQLNSSLMQFGFESFNLNDAELLNKTSLDFADVRLYKNFVEFTNALTQFDTVLQKDLNRDTLTEEEQTIKNIYQSIGIFDEATLQRYTVMQEVMYDR